MSLISDYYMTQLEILRDKDHEPMWGNSGKQHIDAIEKLLRDRSLRLKSLVDYGCGHGYIINELIRRGMGPRCGMTGYDPGIAQCAALPDPADMLISTDVLEHIEPECLDDVLKHMASLTLKMAYINISYRLARTILPDGRNAHLIVQPPSWWKEQLEKVYSRVELFKLNERKEWVAYIAYP